jgi:hypothetical protein
MPDEHDRSGQAPQEIRQAAPITGESPKRVGEPDGAEPPLMHDADLATKPGGVGPGAVDKDDRRLVVIGLRGHVWSLPRWGIWRGPGGVPAAPFRQWTQSAPGPSKRNSPGTGVVPWFQIGEVHEPPAGGRPATRLSRRTHPDDPNMFEEAIAAPVQSATSFWGLAATVRRHAQVAGPPARCRRASARGWRSKASQRSIGARRPARPRGSAQGSWPRPS